ARQLVVIFSLFPQIAVKQYVCHVYFKRLRCVSKSHICSIIYIFSLKSRTSATFLYLAKAAVQQKRRKMAEKRNQIKVKYHKASAHSHSHSFAVWKLKSETNTRITRRIRILLAAPESRQHFLAFAARRLRL
ncbi:hypothetical protein M5D96_006463, partial [Drosophila gunungcola]